MNINQRIKNLRKDMDLTQKQVADTLYMQVTQYRRYETGERTIPVDIAIQLSEIFDVSLDYLACLSQYDEKIIKKELSVSEKVLLTNFRRLNRQNRLRVLERAETLLDVQEK